MEHIDYSQINDPVAKDIIEEFIEITKIPHASGNCREICSYFCDWAKANNLVPETDNTGNFIVNIPSTPGYERSPVTILQTHMDMVYVSDDSAKGIEPIIENGYLKSQHSSIGADDNIGTAIIMNLIKSDIVHGPIKWISTVDEETSMCGANTIDKSHFKGVNYLINIDSENYDRVCVSSAGGCNIEINKKPIMQLCKKDYALKITISGLIGGHSGMNIQYNRLNGILAVSRILNSLLANGIDFDIISAKAGTATNAIPLFAEISIVVNKKNINAVQSTVDNTNNELINEYKNIENNIRIDLTETELPSRIISGNDTAAILNILSEIPNGVIEFSKEINDFVETSSNIGIMELSEKLLTFKLLSRSSNKESLKDLVYNIKRISKNYEFKCKTEYNADPWELKSDNELIPMILESFKKITGEEMVTEAIHAGLETGAFASKNPKMNIASIGPDIFEPHSLNERCRIESISVTRNVIVKVLKLIAEKK